MLPKLNWKNSLTIVKRFLVFVLFMTSAATIDEYRFENEKYFGSGLKFELQKVEKKIGDNKE